MTTSERKVVHVEGKYNQAVYCCLYLWWWWFRPT